MRYNKSDLIAAIDEANEELEEMGSSRRLQHGHRYGYNAVDECDVYDGHGGLRGTVETGTPSDCIDGINCYVSAKYREHAADDARQKVEFADAVLSLLSGSATIREVRRLAKPLMTAQFGLPAQPA